MGLFSSIGNAVKSAVGHVTSAFGGDAIGAIASTDSLLSGIGGMFSGLTTGGLSMLPGIAGSATSAYLSGKGQDEANAANAALARAQMDFQKAMSDTAHQREVKDLMSAGLNPMLSNGGIGASTPLGASAVMQNAAGAGVASGQSALSLAQQAQQLKIQSQQMDLNERTVKLQENKNANENDLLRAQALQSLASSNLSTSTAKATDTMLPRNVTESVARTRQHIENARLAVANRILSQAHSAESSSRRERTVLESEYQRLKNRSQDVRTRWDERNYDIYKTNRESQQQNAWSLRGPFGIGFSTNSPQGTNLD